MFEFLNSVVRNLRYMFRKNVRMRKLSISLLYFVWKEILRTFSHIGKLVTGRGNLARQDISLFAGKDAAHPSGWRGSMRLQGAKDGCLPDSCSVLHATGSIGMRFGFKRLGYDLSSNR